MNRYYNLDFLVTFVIVSVVLMFSFMPSLSMLIPQPAYAEAFIARVNQQTFFPGERLVVYGKGSPNDAFVFRLYDPSGRAIKIDSIPADDDGFFKKAVFEWPDPTRNLAFGTYQAEVSSSLGDPKTQRIEVNFAEGGSQSTDTLGASVQHILSVKLDAPADVQIMKKFRIFVQVTYDGALVDSDPASLLGTSHIHSGNNTINLSDSFFKLHEGLYYADVTLPQEGSYIIHASAFYRGFVSHDSRVVSAATYTINTVQDSINNLDRELEGLHAQLDETRSTLNQTGTSITDSVSQARASIGEDIASAKVAVNETREASGQLNSLILPVLALISVIIALQISLFARIRASYR
jgi:hypothetical protein